MAPQAAIRWNLPSPERIVCSLNGKRQDRVTIQALRDSNSEDDEAVRLRSENTKMEGQLQESRERQGRLKAQAEEVKLRVGNTEKAEERLCSQLHALDDEVKERSRSFRLQVEALRIRLQQTQDALDSTRAELRAGDFVVMESSHS